ncbi:MAG: hypothetical protein AB7O97_18540 [Planctomycetota bacterium]
MAGMLRCKLGRFAPSRTARADAVRAPEATDDTGAWTQHPRRTHPRDSESIRSGGAAAGPAGTRRAAMQHPRSNTVGASRRVRAGPWPLLRQRRSGWVRFAPREGEGRKAEYQGSRDGNAAAWRAASARSLALASRAAASAENLGSLRGGKGAVAVDGR